MTLPSCCGQRKVIINKDIKQQWLTALRSGKYKQNKGQLRQNGKYCVLNMGIEISMDR
jgi:hypothetical protein